VGAGGAACDAVGAPSLERSGLPERAQAAVPDNNEAKKIVKTSLVARPPSG
jgi:hypothetical protein